MGTLAQIFFVQRRALTKNFYNADSFYEIKQKLASALKIDFQIFGAPCVNGKSNFRPIFTAAA